MIRKAEGLIIHQKVAKPARKTIEKHKNSRKNLENPYKNYRKTI